MRTYLVVCGNGVLMVLAREGGRSVRLRAHDNFTLPNAWCELNVNVADAWGDAPPLITCPSACTDSEKSFALRRLHSSPYRRDHESRSKQRGLPRSPSISPFPLVKCSPTLSQQQLSRSTFQDTAYFNSFPPSTPLTLVVRGSDKFVDTVHAFTSTTSIKRSESYYAGIRSLVEEIADAAADGKRATKSHVITAGNCSLNIPFPKSHLNRAMQRKRFRRHSVPVTRNVAVQAVSITVERKDHHEKNATGWVGGVRALRDSHVRHVLRQLKHIDRLNRALDRVHHSETD